MNIPPFQVFGANLFSYEQIKRSFYFWFFQMQEVSEDIISANDIAFIDNIWEDWSPGYDATEDLPLVKECLKDPAHFQTALGYYWGSSIPSASALPCGRRSKKPRGAARSLSPSSTCTARMMVATASMSSK